MIIHYLLRILGWPLGLRFATDNHVVPILRWGRFSRVRGPGFFWITPLLEETLTPIDTSIQVAQFTFVDVLSQDNIPFTFYLTVLYQFDPNLAPQQVAAQLVRVSSKVLKDIVHDYLGELLLRTVSMFKAEDLCSHLLTIERDLLHPLRLRLHNLGLIPMQGGGILIERIIPPEQFKQIMLNVEQQEAIMEELIDHRHLDNMQALIAEFLTFLTGRNVRG